MTQTERRLFLIKELLREQPRYRDMDIPENIQDQKNLLRSLFNIRMPKPVTAEFLKVQDEYLQTETAGKGITDIADLTPLQEDLYLWQGDITTLHCDAIVNAANSQMLGCFCPCHGCIDNAIHTFSGVQLRMACADLMRSKAMKNPQEKQKSPLLIICPASMCCIRWDRSFGVNLQGGMKNCWPPATAPVWSLQKRTM